MWRSTEAHFHWRCLLANGSLLPTALTGQCIFLSGWQSLFIMVLGSFHQRSLKSVTKEQLRVAASGWAAGSLTARATKVLQGQELMICPYRKERQTRGAQKRNRNRTVTSMTGNRCSAPRACGGRGWREGAMYMHTSYPQNASYCL